MPTVNRLSPDVFVVEELFTREECSAWITQSEDIGYCAATISGQRKKAVRREVRNNDRVILDSEELADSLWQRVSEFAPGRYIIWESVGLNERFRFYRYDPGQRFDWHSDAVYQHVNGSQSWYTLLIYLNDDFDGGATGFKKFRVVPKVGSALFFMHKALHQGESVSKGRKYVLRTDVMFQKHEKKETANER